MKNLKVSRISIAFGWILFFGLFPFTGSGAKLADVKVVNPAYGPAKISGEDAGYFYSARITADTRTTVEFKQDTCLLLAKNGKSYSKYWIHIAGASAGLSMNQRDGISKKALAVELEGGHSSGVNQWNASVVDGPAGSIEFTIPKGGYVELDFLWEVPQGFTPGRIKIHDLIDLAIN